MNLDETVKATAEVIELVQKDGGLDVPPLDDKTCPLDLENFDSMMWPYVMVLLGKRLKIDIPNNVNIFKDKTNPRKKLTIREIATRLCEFPAVQEVQQK